MLDFIALTRTNQLRCIEVQSGKCPLNILNDIENRVQPLNEQLLEVFALNFTSSNSHIAQYTVRGGGCGTTPSQIIIINGANQRGGFNEFYSHPLVATLLQWLESYLKSKLNQFLIVC